MDGGGPEFGHTAWRAESILSLSFCLPPQLEPLCKAQPACYTWQLGVLIKNMLEKAVVQLSVCVTPGQQTVCLWNGHIITFLSLMVGLSSLMSGPCLSPPRSPVCVYTYPHCGRGQAGSWDQAACSQRLHDIKEVAESWFKSRSSDCKSWAFLLSQAICTESIQRINEAVSVKYHHCSSYICISKLCLCNN